MKCRILRHFIWGYTVCKSTRLRVSRIQRIKAKICSLIVIADEFLSENALANKM